MCSKLLLGSSLNYYWVQAQNYKMVKCGVVRLKPKNPTTKTETHKIRNRKIRMVSVSTFIETAIEVVDRF